MRANRLVLLVAEFNPLKALWIAALTQKLGPLRPTAHRRPDRLVPRPEHRLVRRKPSRSLIHRSILFPLSLPLNPIIVPFRGEHARVHAMEPAGVTFATWRHSHQVARSARSVSRTGCSQGSVRLAGWFRLGCCQPGCCRAACDSSGVWPLCVCLGNDLSACARRRRSGVRCWLDQELVRLVGVTHYRPAAAQTHAPAKPSCRHTACCSLVYDAAATTSSATSVGVVPTLMPTASSASFF